MEELRKKYYNEVNKNYYKIKNGYSDEQMNQVNPALYANFDSKQLHDGFENENLLEFQTDTKYRLKDSNASFDVRDVQGIIFGG